MNGWNDDGSRQFNLVNSNWFGFRVSKWYNGNLIDIGLRINDKKFGWFEYYNPDGSIDTENSGFFLNNDKI